MMEALAPQVAHLGERLMGMGTIVFVPLVILITSLAFRVPWMKAVRSAITVGVGFIGVGLTLAIVWQTLGPVTQEVAQQVGLRIDVLDVSWPAGAAVSFTTLIGAFIIPFILLINYLMLITRQTRTLNIDIWNYWHYAISGSLAALITNSLWLGFIEAGCHAVITFKFADITAKRMQKEMNMPGISIPHGNSVAMAPLLMLLDRIYDAIPFLKPKHRAEMVAQNKLLKFFSDPMVVGFIIGGVLGILARAPVEKVIQIAISMAALILLLPREVKIIMEGLVPISQATKKLVEAHFGRQDYYVGLDSAVMLNYPATTTTSMLLIPITILLAFVLPWNHTIPVGDLCSIGFFIAVAAPLHKGSVARTLISGTVIMSIMLVICSQFAPAFTQLARVTGGVVIPEGTTLISSIAIGDPIAWIGVSILRLGEVGGILLILLTAGVVAVCKAIERRQDSGDDMPRKTGNTA